MTLKRFELLKSPALLTSVGVLILNDFVLKSAFHNWFTGKLSDFAGLAAFTLFSCAMFPARTVSVGVTVTAGFVYWKSAQSQALIDWINGHLPFYIGRTADLTDLVALPVVWWVCARREHFRLWSMQRIQVFGVAASSLVAFTATSSINRHVIRETAVTGSTQIESPLATAAAIQELLDVIAKKHGLQCTICDPVEKGRAYAYRDSRIGENSVLTFTANFDPAKSVVWYEIETQNFNAPVKYAKVVDAIQSELQGALRSRYPQVIISPEAQKSSKNIALWVANKSGGSYQLPENQVVIQAVKDQVRKVTMSKGLQQLDDDSYGVGRLFGPHQSSRNLVVAVHVYIVGPTLMNVAVECRTVDCEALQRELSRELEQKLKEVMGADRITIGQ